MKVKDIMTKNVASLNPEDTVEHAAQLMKEYNIGSLPVCNEEKVIGIITDRDIAIRSSAEGENVQKQTVRDIMTSNPVTIKSDIDVEDAARIMSERQIRRLPVIESNNLVGMLSLGDVSVESGSNETAGEALSNISEPSTPLL
ncbi:MULTISPECIES: CBS domain-containing protein [unclassified Clostridium]|uniref:CBS domain-containing protein n=1 Tax=unclassified Clostridium TaxID=2614128 RepID=UPI00052E1907|nr:MULTISPECIES: CBS domain-containing protein [unclassified Clostridium]KGK90744.1 CBS domain-containing protein YhcV [Clostridium sp. HMP27]MBE6066391.1 CBS domain-containing protein [Clostridium lundense]